MGIFYASFTDGRGQSQMMPIPTLGKTNDEMARHIRRTLDQGSGSFEECWYEDDGGNLYPVRGCENEQVALLFGRMLEMWYQMYHEDEVLAILRCYGRLTNLVDFAYARLAGSIRISRGFDSLREACGTVGLDADEMIELESLIVDNKPLSEERMIENRLRLCENVYLDWENRLLVRF